MSMQEIIATGATKVCQDAQRLVMKNGVMVIYYERTGPDSYVKRNERNCTQPLSR